MAKTLSYLEVAEAAYSGGFRGASLRTAIALTVPESGKVEDRESPPNSDGSVDMGLWQINSVHKQYSEDCKKSRFCCAKAAFDISKGGTNFTPWTAYKRRLYVPFLPAAEVAAAYVVRTGGTIPGSDHGLIPPVSDIPVIGDVVDAGKATAGFLTLLGQRTTWIRTGYVILGGLILMVAVVMLAKELGATKAAGKLAKLTPVAKAVSTIKGGK